MPDDERVAIIGTGFAVPPHVRKNDDPIFDWLRSNHPAGEDLFQGYEERRVLGPGETVSSLMVAAAHQALARAALEPSSIDALLGYGSVSEYITPNNLAQVHAELGLPSRALVLPVADEFTNFNSSILLADSLIRVGQARTILIVCGCNWTQFVHYHTPPSTSAGDGSGAAVVGVTTDPTRFRLIAHEHLVSSGDYGAMYMQGDVAGECGEPPPPCYSSPYFHLTERGQAAFGRFGANEAPTAVTRLLANQHIDGSQVSVLCHQASTKLLGPWRDTIKPHRLIDTLEQYANMTLATIPVNLALFADEIATDYLVLFGLGIQLHASALLLERG